MQLTQTSVDTIDIEEFGPASLCTITWDGRDEAESFLVATSNIKAVKQWRGRAVDRVHGLEHLVVLSDAGLNVVTSYGVTVASGGTTSCRFRARYVTPAWWTTPSAL